MNHIARLFPDRNNSTLDGREQARQARNNILADRVLADLIQQLDAVRDLHAQANTADALQRAQTLVDDALRQATNFLFELRRKQLGI
jgi:predicted deacylase